MFIGTPYRAWRRAQARGAREGPGYIKELREEMKEHGVAGHSSALTRHFSKKVLFMMQICYFATDQPTNLTTKQYITDSAGSPGIYSKIGNSTAYW